MNDLLNAYQNELNTSQRPGQQLAWANLLRQQAMQQLLQHGFPKPKDEDWKYTRVNGILSSYMPSTLGKKSHEVHSFQDWDCYQLHFYDGHLVNAKQPALAQDLIITNLATAMQSHTTLIQNYFMQHHEHGFSALNSALWQDGAFVFIPDNLQLSKPVQLIFHHTSEHKTSHIRNVIIAGKNSAAEIIEVHTGENNNQYFTNTISDIVTLENAQLKHYKLQLESDKAFHVGTVFANLNRNSTFYSYQYSLGALLNRSDLQVQLQAENSECHLNGLYITEARQHCDHHTTVDHQQPHTNSNEDYRGILSGHSRAVFNGKVIVRPDAQKINAKQLNKNILLSDHAEIDTKPQLEIFADDVKCAHGATIGQLDDQALFYLQSRGLNLQQAQQLLIKAFIEDVLNDLTIIPLKNYLTTTLHKKITRLFGEQS